MLSVNLNQDFSKINKYISNTLLKNIDENMKNNKKVILYLNKRWEYSSLICKKCNHLHKCKNCDISMSLHWDNMICHSCWYSKIIISNCENCKSKELQKVWVGTKQIEDVIKNIYKDKIVYRLDTDIVKNKKTKEEALNNIEKADIVIGTKMITTGFNFLNVWLIWVILLEQELQIASYNTEEKVFSNIKQLLWRGWRLWQKTDFIIQTFIPENPIIQSIINDNYKDFFIKTLKERKDFKYPPFCELATLEYRNRDQEKAKKFIEKIYKKLLDNKQEDIEVILWNNYFRRYNQYYYKIIIKWKNIRLFLEKIKSEIYKNSELVVIFD